MGLQTNRQIALWQDEVPAFDAIVGHSEPMQEVLRQLERISQSQSTVLICGESGTGKELVAEAIHKASPRRAGPYIAVNMAAVPDTLIESELFGHIKGAFTDAGCNRQGRFEAADTGTLFIDEIGDLKLTSQAKLLRVLEERRVTPVGGNQSKAVDVRVLAATNRPLEAMVVDNEFRQDLYYRLNVIVLAVPPLRERPDDILLLVDYFLEQVCRACGKARPQLDPELAQFLVSYRWPGNVRQLRNCIESMVVLAASDTLTVDDLPAMVREVEYGLRKFEIPPDLTLDEIEKSAVVQTLHRCKGNRTRAARTLDISVRTLQRRLKRWGLAGDGDDVNRFRSDGVGDRVFAGAF